MKIDLSDEEKNAALLLSGATSYILNIIASQHEAIQRYDESLKHVIEEKKNLQKEVDNLQSEIQRLQSVK